MTAHPTFLVQVLRISNKSPTFLRLQQRTRANRLPSLQVTNTPKRCHGGGQMGKGIQGLARPGSSPPVSGCPLTPLCPSFLQGLPLVFFSLGAVNNDVSNAPSSNQAIVSYLDSIRKAQSFREKSSWASASLLYGNPFASPYRTGSYSPNPSFTLILIFRSPV